MGVDIRVRLGTIFGMYRLAWCLGDTSLLRRERDLYIVPALDAWWLAGCLACLESGMAG